MLKDRISVGGKRLREFYEPINHEKAFHYVKDCVGKGYALDEKIVKDIHVMPIQNILAGEFTEMRMCIIPAHSTHRHPPMR